HQDRLRAAWKLIPEQPDNTIASEAMGWLQGIERDLRQQALPYEEWEVLFREKMQVERGILQMLAGIADRPRDLTEGAPESATEAQTARAGRVAPGRVAQGAAAVGAGASAPAGQRP